jgi:hypothetical protein
VNGLLGGISPKNVSRILLLTRLINSSPNRLMDQIFLIIVSSDVMVLVETM